MDDNLYWLMLMWSICETLYLYEYSKMFLVRVHVRTHMNIRLAHVLVDWLRFTSHGHGDVELIMWAHVRHEIELTQHEMMTSHYTICTLCPDLRSSYVLKMWTDLLRSHQTLHHNWVIIKVVFGSVKNHAVRHSQSGWDLPLSTRERYLWAPWVIRIKKCKAMLGLRVNQGFRITGSRKCGRL